MRKVALAAAARDGQLHAGVSRYPRIIAFALVTLLAGAMPRAGWAAPAAAAATTLNGKQLYMQNCASCHGESGRGDGPEAHLLIEPPRNLHDGVLRKYSTEVLVRRVRDGRTLELAVDLPALKARANDTEAIVAHMQRLPTIDWRQVELGWGMYIDDCEICHGIYGRPPEKLPAGAREPRDLSEPAFQRSVSDRQLIDVIRHGKAHMPGLVPRLSEKDAAAVVAYVRILSPGYALYSDHCAACHGDDGRGVEIDSAAMNLPMVVFDRAYFSQHDPEELRDGVWHMIDEHKPIMPHFRRDLTEAQVRAIVEYLEHTEPHGDGKAPARSRRDK